AVDLRQHLVQRFAAAGPAAELLAAHLDLGVGEAVELRLVVADLVDLQGGVGKAALGRRAEQGLELVAPARAEALRRRRGADELRGRFLLGGRAGGGRAHGPGILGVPVRRQVLHLTKIPYGADLAKGKAKAG